MMPSRAVTVMLANVIGFMIAVSFAAAQLRAHVRPLVPGAVLVCDLLYRRRAPRRTKVRAGSRREA